MLDNHVSKGGFRYVEGKRTHKDPKRTIDMIILNDTVFILFLSLLACL